MMKGYGNTVTEKRLRMEFGTFLLLVGLPGSGFEEKILHRGYNLRRLSNGNYQIYYNHGTHLENISGEYTGRELASAMDIAIVLRLSSSEQFVQGE